MKYVLDIEKFLAEKKEKKKTYFFPERKNRAVKNDTRGVNHRGTAAVYC